MPNDGQKPEILIEGWQLLELHRTPFFLLGFVTDHPKISGFRRRIRTSVVLSLDEANGYAETVNSRYRLMHPVTDMTFHPDGSVARISLGAFSADRVLNGDEWLVMRGADPMTSVPSPKPVDAIYRLLALETGRG
jgi:hypothetical protein